MEPRSLPLLSVPSQLSPPHATASCLLKIRVHWAVSCSAYVFRALPFLRVPPNKTLIFPLLSPNMLHATPISSSLTSWRWKHKVISTNHEAPHYAVFSSLYLRQHPQAATGQRCGVHWAQRDEMKHDVIQVRKRVRTGIDCTDNSNCTAVQPAVSLSDRTDRVGMNIGMHWECKSPVWLQEVSNKMPAVQIQNDLKSTEQDRQLCF